MMFPARRMKGHVARRRHEARELRRGRTGCPEKHGRKARKREDALLDRRHCERNQIPAGRYLA